jgi:dihydroflavonol-4-reductase
VGDLLDDASVAQLLEGNEVLIHLAGRVSRDPEDGPALYRLHVEGTRKLLLQTAAARVGRVILASTSGTIGVATTPRVATEADDPPITVVGRWPYYLSKIYQEKLALSFCAEHDLPLVCLNPSLLLGPGDERFSSVGDVWKFLHRDIPAMPSGGISFVDVRDVAEAFVSALERGRAGERYLLGAVNMTFAEFFGRLSRLADVPPPRLHLPSELKIWSTEGLTRLARWRGREPGIDRASVEMGEHYFYIDSEKAKDELGFNPRDPQETLKDTVRDLQNRRGPGPRSQTRMGTG